MYMINCVLEDSCKALEDFNAPLHDLLWVFQMHKMLMMSLHKILITVTIKFISIIWLIHLPNSSWAVSLKTKIQTSAVPRRILLPFERYGHPN